MLESILSSPEPLKPFLTWLSTLTLVQIWVAIYNLSNKFNLTIALLLISLKLPGWISKARQWRYERNVQSFVYVQPKEANQTWKGKIIKRPGLFAHTEDNSLLPLEANTVEKREMCITCYDPSTGYHLATLPLHSDAQVAKQITVANCSFPSWRTTTFAQRRLLLRTIRNWIIRDMDSIVAVACRDTGKTNVDAVFGEILTTLSKIDWLINHGEKCLTPSRRAGNLLLAHKVSQVHYHPLGTVLALVSWNYSFHNLISPILAALFAGNTIVIKCSEQVAWSSLWFMGGIKECLRVCGLNQNVAQLVVCLPEGAEKVTRNPLFKHITCDESVGRKVAAAAAAIMVPTCIELGGKDPAFIMPGTDLEFYASTWMRGAFQSAGQNCIGIELFLIHRSQYDSFIKILTPRVQALRPGKDVGSLISHASLPKLESLLSSAVTSGARVLAGGKVYSHREYPQGAYFEPTLIVDVTMDMNIAKEELFAPVMTVVPYDDVDQAVEWLNMGRFGLGGGVYGKDRLACERVAEKLECGMVAINDFGVFYLNQAMPFGGVKASGHGRFGGEEGLRNLCSVKAITKDRLFSWIRTTIPRPVDFPLPGDESAWAFLTGLVGFAYAPSVWERGKGLVKLIKASI
nr:meiotic Sister-Chromatid recombination aldehyde dehydrogenase [Cryptococcus depauperatus CBS 7841]